MIWKNSIQRKALNNIKDIDKSILVDLKDVKIDKSLSVEDRMISYVQQIKNPYLFKVGDMAVKIRFTNSGQSLRDKLVSIIKFYNR